MNTPNEPIANMIPSFQVSTLQKNLGQTTRGVGLGVRAGNHMTLKREPTIKETGPTRTPQWMRAAIIAKAATHSTSDSSDAEINRRRRTPGILPAVDRRTPNQSASRLVVIRARDHHDPGMNAIKVGRPVFSRCR